MNTAFGATTNSGLPNSGFYNTGTGMSGFFNTATGPQPGFISGFGNTASGGTVQNRFSSGFFNTGVPGILGPTVSGFDSGLFNMGTAVSGLFNLSRLLT